MLFSTSFLLGPNKLPIQLQVNQGPSPAQSGTPGPRHATHRGPQSPYLHDCLTPSEFVPHSRMHGEEQEHGVHRAWNNSVVATSTVNRPGHCFK